MHKQFAVAPRLTVENVALFVRTYVYAAGEDLSVFYQAERVLEVDLSRPYTFDFSAEKSNSGFVGILDEIVVIRFFVLGNYLAGFFVRRKNSSFPTNKMFDFLRVIFGTAFLEIGSRHVGDNERVGEREHLKRFADVSAILGGAG